jgi:hypothetical protein
MSTDRRGTGEEGKDGESARENRRRKGFNHGDDGGRGRGSRCEDGMDGDVGSGAESAVGVGFAAVGVAVGDLHGAEEDDQQDAKEREEDSPGRFGACAADFFTHTIQLYRRMRGRGLRMRRWV